MTNDAHYPGQLITIIGVDTFGHLGRDFHPQDRHVGRLAVVDDTETFECLEDPESSYRVVNATTLTGEKLELMDFEVKSFQVLTADAVPASGF